MVGTGEQKPDLSRFGFLQPLWKIVPTRGEDEWAWFVFHTRSGRQVGGLDAHQWNFNGKGRWTAAAQGGCNLSHIFMFSFWFSCFS